MINKFISYFITLISFTLPVSICIAQPDPSSAYVITHFTDANGLPQNSINDLLFDEQGQCWLGSQVGLVRFNGYSFKLYYPEDKPSMESNIALLGKNKQGHIFFQTDDHHLYCYPGKNSHLLKAVNTWGIQDPKLLNARKQIFDFTAFLHPAGMAGANNTSDKRRQIFNQLFHRNTDFFAVDSLRTYLLYKDSIYYFDGRGLQALAPHPGPGSYCLVLNGNFYVIRQDQVVYACRHGRQFIHPSRVGGDRPLSRDTAFRHFSSGDVDHWLVGPRLYRLESDSSGYLKSHYLTDLSPIVNITAIEYDKDLDLLVVATGTDGFYTLKKGLFSGPPFPSGLKAQLARHLFGPVTLYNGAEIMTDRFIFDAAGHYRMVKDSSGGWLKCLYTDKHNNIFTSRFNQPRMLDRDMAVTKTWPALDGQVIDYEEDRLGRIYCLTSVSLWRLENGSFHQLITKEELGLQGSNESLGWAGPDKLLVANTIGMAEVDCAKARTSARPIPLFSGAHVRCIAPCRDGSVFIGTYGQGYFYYRSGRYIKMPLDKNGFLITAHCFLEDSHDNIWIACNKGLFRVPKSDLDAWCESSENPVYYYYYDRDDGLQTNEFNGGFNSPGLITANNFVTLLSMKGMVCFYTDSLKADFPSANVSVTNMEIDGVSGGRTDSIVLSQDYNNLLLEISCPFLGNRNNLYLEYRLRGLDTGWMALPQDGNLYLSRLSPGCYTLQVRKVNGFGPGNYTYREWPVTVSAHFYRKPWFRVLAGLAIALLIVLLGYFWLKFREKRREATISNEKLKGTVATLEETVKKLQESEKALLYSSALREKLIALVIHDLRSPMRFLTMLASDLHDNQEQLSPADMKERTYWVKKGTKDIYHFSEDFLLWVSSQRDNFSINKSYFPLEPLFQEIYDFFREQVMQKGNTISFSADDLGIYSDPHILITIIRNLVDNANKYTEKGEIRITAQEKGTYILISISDTGKGMTPEQVAKFFPQDGMEAVQTSSQLGHKFVFDLTRQINGSVSIESWPGAGTTVRVKLPRTS